LKRSVTDISCMSGCCTRFSHHAYVEWDKHSSQCRESQEV